MSTHKELKKLLRALRKQKRETQPKSDARRQINRQIRVVKEQLSQFEIEQKPDSEKQALMDKLTELYRDKRRPMLVDFKAYSKEELQVHLSKVSGGKL